MVWTKVLGFDDVEVHVATVPLVTKDVSSCLVTILSFVDTVDCKCSVVDIVGCKCSVVDVVDWTYSVGNKTRLTEHNVHPSYWCSTRTEK